MRHAFRGLAVVLGLASLVLMTAPAAFAGSVSASPRHRLESSASTQLDATIALEPFTETERFRSWSIAVTGGVPSVTGLEVPDSGSSLYVTVEGESATVELTLTLSGNLAVRASCFDFDKQMEIGRVESGRRLVLDVVPDGLYECRYDTERAGRSVAPNASVPPTDAAVESPETPARWPWILVMVAAVIAGTVLVVHRAQRPRIHGVT